MENSKPVDFWERKLGDEFPQVSDLARGDWTSVEFKWNGKTFEIKTFKYNTSEIEDTITDENTNGIFFGLWEVNNEDGKKLTPIGFFHGLTHGDVAEFGKSNPALIGMLPENIDLNGIGELVTRHSSFDIFVSRDYRNLSESIELNVGNYIIYLFHAMVLVTLSEMEVNESRYYLDITDRKRVQRTPQYSDTSSVAKTIMYPSFYSKFSNLISQTGYDLKSGAKSVDTTTVSTKLTGVQHSMIRQAFGK